ncbi:SEC-C metal-binding domain-containing protein [Amycolatopsis samaneae]
MLSHVEGDGVGWPPGRNDVCWCGSACKYKKCCGAPGFTAAPA